MSALATTGRSGLSGRSQADAYLRARFGGRTQAWANGETLPTGGPGLWSVVDTGAGSVAESADDGYLSITGSGSSWTATGIVGPAVSRAVGQAVVFDIEAAAGTVLGVGLNSAASLTTPSGARHGLYTSGGAWYCGSLSSSHRFANVGAFTADTRLRVALVLDKGAVSGFNGALTAISEDGGNFDAKAWTPYDSLATLYPFLTCYSGTLKVRGVVAPRQAVVPNVSCFDSFTRADGALGSTETAGPFGSTPAALAWTTYAGAPVIANSKFSYSGGIDVAGVTPTDSADCLTVIEVDDDLNGNAAAYPVYGIMNRLQAYNDGYRSFQQWQEFMTYRLNGSYSGFGSNGNIGYRTGPMMTRNEGADLTAWLSTYRHTGSHTQNQGEKTTGICLANIDSCDCEIEYFARFPLTQTNLAFLNE